MKNSCKYLLNYLKMNFYLFNFGFVVFYGDFLFHQVVVLLLRFTQHGHGPHVYRFLELVFRLCQLLDRLPGLFRVVSLEIVGSVGLVEELSVVGDPLVLLQHRAHSTFGAFSFTLSLNRIRIILVLVSGETIQNCQMTNIHWGPAILTTY